MPGQIHLNWGEGIVAYQLNYTCKITSNLVFLYAQGGIKDFILSSSVWYMNFPVAISYHSFCSFRY